MANLAQFNLPPPLGQSNSEYEAFPQTTGNIIGSTLGSGVSGTIISSPTGPSVPNSNAANPQGNTTPAPTPSAISSGSLADYFARGIIIVLGFIFIAIGLDMLKPGVVPGALNPRTYVR